MNTTLVKASQVHHGRTRVQSCFRGRHRQRRSQAHTEAESGRVQVSCLGVVQGVGASRRRCVVPRRLISESTEGEGIRVHQGGREPPWFIRCPRSGILVPEGLMAQAVASLEMNMLAVRSEKEANGDAGPNSRSRVVSLRHEDKRSDCCTPRARVIALLVRLGHSGRVTGSRWKMRAGKRQEAVRGGCRESQIEQIEHVPFLGGDREASIICGGGLSWRDGC